MKSIIKESKELRDALVKTWTLLYGSRFQTRVHLDAVENGRKDILRDGINRYIHDPNSYSALNEEKILWLARRYKIDVTLLIERGEPSPKDYDLAESDVEKAKKYLKKNKKKKKK